MTGTFITITHIPDYALSPFLRIGETLKMKKDHDNIYDEEAILVCKREGTKVGYCANSVKTVCRGTHSAGYVYHLFDEETECELCFITPEGSAIARLKDENL